MTQISQRGKTIFASPFRKYLPLADAAKARGVDVIHLNIGQPDFPMPANTVQDFRWTGPDFVPYGVAEGETALREQWCRYYEKFDIQVHHGQVLITTGASEALQLALLAIADPGDEIIVPEPFYANYNGFCQIAGVNIVPLPSSIDDGFPLPEMDAFASAITDRTRCILLSNPNNPSGKIYPPTHLEQLLRLAVEHDIYLLIDEAYSEFVYDGFDFQSILTFRGADQHVIVADSVSKRFNACGLRVGAMVSRNAEVITTVTNFSRLRLSPPMLAQGLANSLLQTGPEYFESLREEFARRRQIILDRLSRMEGVVFHAPEGAFYILARLPIADSEHFSSWLLQEFSHDNRTVMVAPGTGFYAGEGCGLDEVRIAYILEPQRIELAMDCLERALAEYPQRTIQETTAITGLK